MFRLFLFYTESFEQTGEEPYLIFAPDIEKAFKSFSTEVSEDFEDIGAIDTNVDYMAATWSNYCDHNVMVTYLSGKVKEYGVMELLRNNIQ